VATKPNTEMQPETICCAQPCVNEIKTESKIAAPAAADTTARFSEPRRFGFLPRMCQSSAGSEVTFVQLDDFEHKSGLYEYYWEDESIENALNAFRGNLKAVLRG
jgi:hypothetical protein